MTKQEQIDQFLKEPIKAGDEIIVKGLNSKNPEMTSLETVVRVESDHVFIKRYNYTEESFNIKDISKSTNHIGSDPFQSVLRVDTIHADIKSLFFKLGFNSYKNTFETLGKYYDEEIPMCNFDPIITDSNGNDIKYQRPFVWTLEDKQNLIESIYNHIDIGKFIFRTRSFDWIKKRIKMNKLEGVAEYDIVDGKQRAGALLEFIQDKFRDHDGNFYNDLSERGKNKFLGYRNLQLGTITEEASDQDVLNTFKAVNFAGVQMSKEHLDYVKSIKL